MKVIIAGGRDFNDYKSLKSFCSRILINVSNVEIVSGGAEGADKRGEWFADDMGYLIKRFPADWGLGKKAGAIRNKQMAIYADALIAFWDGESKGTKNMISTAKRLGLEVRVIKYKQKNEA